MNSDSSSYPELRFLSEFEKIGKLQNHLPHWNQDRATCFITFRLGDSIPTKLLADWRNEREEWLQNHAKPWSTESEMEYHKRFSTRIDQWMDQGYGSCLLANPANADQVAVTLHHCDGVRYLIHSRVIMPNHVHVLMSPTSGESLSQIVAGWKRFSATKINKAGETSGSLWQKDYFDRLIRDWDHFINIVRYIRRNPQKAQLKSAHFSLYEAPWIKRLLS